MEIVFWCAAGAMAYSYAVYPALLFVLAWLQPRAPVEGLAPELPPTVSLLVAAYNEAPVILRKLRNCELLTIRRRSSRLFLAPMVQMTAQLTFCKVPACLRTCASLVLRSAAASRRC